MHPGLTWDEWCGSDESARNPADEEAASRRLSKAGVDSDTLPPHHAFMQSALQMIAQTEIPMMSEAAFRKCHDGYSWEELGQDSNLSLDMNEEGEEEAVFLERGAIPDRKLILQSIIGQFDHKALLTLPLSDAHAKNTWKKAIQDEVDSRELRLSSLMGIPTREFMMELVAKKRADAAIKQNARDNKGADVVEAVEESAAPVDTSIPEHIRRRQERLASRAGPSKTARKPVVVAAKARATGAPSFRQAATRAMQASPKNRKQRAGASVSILPPGVSVAGPAVQASVPTAVSSQVSTSSAVIQAIGGNSDPVWYGDPPQQDADKYNTNWWDLQTGKIARTRVAALNSKLSAAKASSDNTLQRSLAKEILCFRAGLRLVGKELLASPLLTIQKDMKQMMQVKGGNPTFMASVELAKKWVKDRLIKHKFKEAAKACQIIKLNSDTPPTVDAPSFAYLVTKANHPEVAIDICGKALRGAFFGDHTNNLFGLPIGEDQMGLPYDIADAYLAHEDDYELVEDAAADQIPDALVQHYAVVEKACHVVVAVRNPTPGYRNCSYTAAWNCLKDEHRSSNMDADLEGFCDALLASEAWFEIQEPYWEEGKHDDEIKDRYHELRKLFLKSEEGDDMENHFQAVQGFFDKYSPANKRTDAFRQLSIAVAGVALRVWGEAAKNPELLSPNYRSLLLKVISFVMSAVPANNELRAAASELASEDERRQQSVASQLLIRFVKDFTVQTSVEDIDDLDALVGAVKHAKFDGDDLQFLQDFLAKISQKAASYVTGGSDATEWKQMAHKRLKRAAGLVATLPDVKPLVFNQEGTAGGVTDEVINMVDNFVDCKDVHIELRILSNDDSSAMSTKRPLVLRQHDLFERDQANAERRLALGVTKDPWVCAIVAAIRTERADFRHLVTGQSNDISQEELATVKKRTLSIDKCKFGTADGSSWRKLVPVEASWADESLTAATSTMMNTIPEVGMLSRLDQLKIVSKCPFLSTPIRNTNICFCSSSIPNRAGSKIRRCKRP